MRRITVVLVDVMAHKSIGRISSRKVRIELPSALFVFQQQWIDDRVWYFGRVARLSQSWHSGEDKVMIKECLALGLPRKEAPCGHAAPALSVARNSSPFQIHAIASHNTIIMP